MSLAFGFALPHWQAISGGAFSPASLFAGGTVAGAWYDPSDLSTLFTTSAGTTQCAMPGQGSAVSVGLMLDKSQGVQRFWSGAFNGSNTQLSVASNAAFTLGSSGDFTIECWLWLNGSQSGVAPVATTFADWSDFFNRWALGVNGLTLRWYDSSGGVGISTTLTAYSWNHIAVARNSSTITLYVNGASVGTQTTNQAYTTQGGVTVGRMLGQAWYLNGYISNLRIVKGTAVYTGNFTPPSPVTGLTAISGTSLLTCQNSTFIDNSSNAFAITVTNAVTSQNIPLGNHAIAFNNTTARPELRARVNLITNSENFAGSGWSGTANVATDVTTAPNGTTTADSITAATTATFRYLRRSPSELLANVQFTWSVSAKKNTADWVTLRFWDTNPGTAAWFNLATGAIGTVQAGCTASISDQGNGWYRCSITRTIGATIAFNETDFQVSSGDNTNNANAGDSVFLWGADLRPANIGANVPAYQRIADANTYDTSGFPLYLLFDGIDDSMYTPANLNLSGTDKVSVFAGVRKLAAGVVNIAAELSANSDSNSGAFGIGAPVNTIQYYWQLNAGNRVDGAVNSGYDSPITNVLTGNFDIAGTAPIDEIKGRLNGVDQTLAFSGVVGAGSGNFGTYPLYIGSRNNSNFFFNGQLYSLIIAGSAVSAGNISATEQWVAQRTGIVIP